MFDVELTEAGGKYTAFCPDLHLACEGQTKTEALHRMQSLIYFYLSAPGDVAFTRGDSPAAAPPAQQKMLCIPPKERAQ